MVKHSPTLVDRLTSRLKNNPVIAAIIMISLIVMGLASFTDALKKLHPVISAFYQTNVTGEWSSTFIRDPVINADFQYIFSLKEDEGMVYGTVQRLAPYCRKHENLGICKHHDQPTAIIDGRINGKEITFLCNWRLPSTEPWKWVQIKENFRGIVSGDEIRFVRQDDINAPAEDFLARRLTEHDASKRTGQ